MPSLDTNVLLRWLLDDVPEQTERARRLIEGDARVRVDDVALIETVFVLETVMRIPRTSIRDAVRLLVSMASLDLDRTLWSRASDLYIAHPKLSIVDIVLALRARLCDSPPLYTFDRKLASQLDDAALLG